MSCLSLRPPTEITDSNSENVQVLKGRIIYKSPEESFSAVFTWRSTGSEYELRLRDRLGLGRVLIKGNSESADIETSRGEILEDVDLQSWLAKEFGISIPILELPDCLTMDCRLVSTGQNHIYDGQNRLIEFEHGEWTIKAVYDSNLAKELNQVSEIQLLHGESKMRMIFDS
ncbi:MAG: outer membrane lipoprotein LolB [Gammaproteobacteria bacterium]|nr:outer membrane lipoprotein LolB [Gammaproteobacteria bacterium]